MTLTEQKDELLAQTNIAREHYSTLIQHDITTDINFKEEYELSLYELAQNYAFLEIGIANIEKAIRIEKKRAGIH